MKSISLLKRRLKTIERRLPKGDVEYEVYLDGDEIPDDGTPVIVLDLLAAIGQLDEDEEQTHETLQPSARA